MHGISHILRDGGAAVSEGERAVGCDGVEVDSVEGAYIQELSIGGDGDGQWIGRGHGERAYGVHLAGGDAEGDNLDGGLIEHIEDATGGGGAAGGCGGAHLGAQRGGLRSAARSAGDGNVVGSGGGGGCSGSGQRGGWRRGAADDDGGWRQAAGGGTRGAGGRGDHAGERDRPGKRVRGRHGDERSAGCAWSHGDVTAVGKAIAGGAAAAAAAAGRLPEITTTSHKTKQEQRSCQQHPCRDPCRDPCPGSNLHGRSSLLMVFYALLTDYRFELGPVLRIGDLLTDLADRFDAQGDS